MGSENTGHLAVEVTPHCNRHCTYCYNVWKGDDSEPPPRELPASELVALVARAIDESGIRALQVTGGEPFLRPDLFEILEGLRPHADPLSLVTDAGLIDEAAARRLARLGVAPVQPTLLAASREVHDRLKGGPSFDKTIAAIGHLRRARVPVSVSFVCTSQNHMHFGEMVELCFALGIRTVAFSRFCATGEGGRHFQALTPSPDMIAECLDVAEQANVRLGLKVAVAISLPLCAIDPARYPHLRFGRCALSSDRPGLTIDPMGRLRGCSVSSEVLGDLRQESFGAIMARAEVGYLRTTRRLPDECGGCAVARACGGGCRESAATCFGSARRADPLARPRAV